MLIDKNMPGMTGDEVIRALRAEPGFDGLPILILSGEPISKSDLKALGADGAVLKPFDIRELIAQLRSFCAGTSRPALDDAADLARPTSLPTDVAAGAPYD